MRLSSSLLTFDLPFLRKFCPGDDLLRASSPSRFYYYSLLRSLTYSAHLQAFTPDPSCPPESLTRPIRAVLRKIMSRTSSRDRLDLHSSKPRLQGTRLSSLIILAGLVRIKSLTEDPEFSSCPPFRHPFSDFVGIFFPPDTVPTV